jgi:putative hemolysin
MVSIRKFFIPILAFGMLLASCTVVESTTPKSSPSLEPLTSTGDPAMPNSTEPTSQAALPNPASEYCEQNEGKLEIRTAADGSQSANCIFQDGSQCEEWAFYRGECEPGQGKEGPAETVQPGYVNETYGFSINPPADWEFEQHPDYLILSRPGARIFIGYQWADEDPKPFRTGMPSGEFIDGGDASLLGQAVPKQILVFEGKNKVVAYNGRIKVGNFILVIYLDPVETVGTSYLDLDIPPELISEADQIIATIALKSGEVPRLEFNP